VYIKLAFVGFVATGFAIFQIAFRQIAGGVARVAPQSISRRTVKADPHSAKIPVVVLASSASDPDIHAAMKFGADSVIETPRRVAE
jgi:hypothetical protein